MAAKLGTEYALGMLIDENLNTSIMRITPSESNCKADKGMDGLFEFMRETGIKKFLLVPVAECATVLSALSHAVEVEGRRIAQFPLCEKCGELSADARKGETMCAFCRDDKEEDRLQ